MSETNQAYFMLGRWTSIQLPSLEEKNVLMAIRVYSHWVRHSHVERATATAVTEVLLERIFPAWKIPSESHKESRTRFIDKFYTRFATLG